MKVAIVGAGAMGSVHAAGWASTGATLVGIVALERSKASALAERYSANVYDDLDMVLPHVDVVDICVPTDLHKTFTLQAAAAHKHILCEKPIARTLADGLEMIAACKAAGVRLFIGMVVRFFPQYRSIYETLAAGRIGKLAVLRLTRASYRPHSGNSNRAKDDWFSDFSRSGGPIFDTLVHDYDYARWLGGEVERVYARATPPDAGGISEYAQVLLRFRSGAIGHIEGGWAYPPPLFRTKVEAAGDGGLIEWESDTSTPMYAHLKAEPGSVAEVGLPLSPLAEDPYTMIIKHFYAALVNNQPFAVTPEDALAAVQIGLAAIESTQSGKPVTLTPLPEVTQ